MSRTPRPWWKRPPLALRNVLANPRRSAIAVLGMGFAIVMALLQLGFLEAVRVTARVQYDPLAFDILLVSAQFDQFFDAGGFPEARLERARSVRGVRSVAPLWARMDMWRCPTPPHWQPPPAYGRPEPPPPVVDYTFADISTRLPEDAPLQLRALLVLGVDLDAIRYRGPIGEAILKAAPLLRQPDRLLFNARSNPDFGSAALGSFNGWELGGRRVQIVGTFEQERGFGADASVLCDRATFARGLPPTMPAGVTFGLVEVEPGAEMEALLALRESLPSDVVALSRAEVYGRESDYWVKRTATGLIFSFGVWLTLLVAMVVIHQVLSTDVRNRLGEYATLRAMGYRLGELSGVVMVQAVLYAVLAFIPAVLLAALLYGLTRRLANIPMVMTAGNLAFVFVLTLLAALLSSVFAVGRLRAANPADLF